MSTVVTRSPEETRALGRRLAAALEPGDVVLLSGELGAGKTVFVQGMAAGLGYGGTVSSKSFVLMGEYHGRITLYHADLYRLEDPQEVADLALDEVSRDGVLAVEWPERAGIPPADEYLQVRFEVAGENERTITFEGVGERGAELARALKVSP